MQPILSGLMLWLYLAALLHPCYSADTGQGTLGFEWRFETWDTEGYTRICASGGSDGGAGVRATVVCVSNTLFPYRINPLFLYRTYILTHSLYTVMCI
jgi:hypothetical protein